MFAAQHLKKVGQSLVAKRSDDVGLAGAVTSAHPHTWAGIDMCYEFRGWLI